MKKETIVILLITLLLLLANTTKAQIEKNRKFFISLDAEQYHGSLLDNMYDFYPNIGIKLFNVREFKIYCKLGISSRLSYEYENFSALILNIESHYAKEKYSLITSIGLYNAGPMGFHLPMTFVWNYHITKIHSIGIHIKPILLSYVSDFDEGRVMKTILEATNFGYGISYYLFIN